jgi:hypothetical protein
MVRASITLRFPHTQSRVLPGKTTYLVCNEFVKRNKRLRTAEELITPSRGRGAQETKKSATSIVLFHTSSENGVDAATTCQFIWQSVVDIKHVCVRC